MGDNSNSDNSDIEYEDMDSFSSEQEQVFSHQQLIMIQFRKCNEAGSVEMKKGFYNNKIDRNGNQASIWMPDTRLIYIQNVKTLLYNLFPDLDKEAKDNIVKIQDDLSALKETLLNSQFDWWDKQTIKYKGEFSSKGLDVVDKKRFNINHIWWSDWMSAQLEASEETFVELAQLLKRLDYFASESATG